MMPQGESHIVDLFFHVEGKQVPVDHSYALYGAISRVLETGVEDKWLHNAENVGLVSIRGHYAGEGVLHLGQHARFGLRLPVHLIPKALRLAGKRLEINGDALRVGVSTTSALIPAPVLYAHIVTTKNGEDEARFDAEVERQLSALDIKGKPARGRHFYRGRLSSFTARYGRCGPLPLRKHMNADSFVPVHIIGGRQ